MTLHQPAVHHKALLRPLDLFRYLTLNHPFVRRPLACLPLTSFPLTRIPFPSLPLTAVALATGLSISPHSSADTQPSSMPDQHSYALEEVIVTAQKREQNTMEVPIAIGTFSPQDMENTGALALEDIADYIPGFEAGGAVTQANLTIRGIESANISSGGDASVATFYDGVYLPRAATTIAFSDMERVEVLKGPQGTLAGRNAAAGSINLVPNRPQLESTDGFIQLKAGNYGLQRWEGMLNLPLSDNLAMRANLLSNNFDGYIDNKAPGGSDIGKQDILTGRVALLWQLSDDTSLQLNYDFDDTDNGPAAISGYSQGNVSFDDAYNDVIDGQETRDMYSAGFRLDHTFDSNWSMGWWANHRELDTTNRQDEDGTSNRFTYLDTDNIESSEITYTELQVNYNSDRINFVGGLTYSKENKSQDTNITSTAETASNLATQVANGLLDALSGGTLPALDHIWNPADWDTLFGILSGGGSPGDFAGLGIPAYSNAEYQATLGSLYGAGLGPLLSDYQEILAGGWVSSDYAGNLWTETVSNTGTFTNFGIYSDVDFAVTDQWNIILGLRYSKDEKDFTWENPLSSMANSINTERAYYASLGIPGVGLIPTATNFLSPLSQTGVGLVNSKVSASDDWSKTTGRAVVQYHVNEDLMTFLSYSTGYTSGGFDSFVLNSAITPLEPEEVTNIEWGIKGDFFSNRLRTQFSYFLMDYKNRQKSVTSADPNIQGLAAPIIISGDEDIDGWELSLTWVPTDTLQLGMVTTMRNNDSEYETYVDAQGNMTDGSSETPDTLSAYTFTLDWAPQLNIPGNLTLHFDYIFKEQDFGPDSPNYLPEYESIDNFGDDIQILNTRLAWSSDDEHYLIALWGKNLLDNQYTDIPGGLTASDLGTAHTKVSAPLTWGIDARYNF